MTLWFVLFLSIILVSFFLAYRSMQDFADYPQGEVGVFLIQNPNLLSASLLDWLHQALQKKEQIISFERLFKGSKYAMVLFGPRDILQTLNLSLLELEDYSMVDQNLIDAWEVGVKDADNPFDNMPPLQTDEQFWWQAVLKPKIGDQDKLWHIQVRAVLLSSQRRRKELLPILQNLRGKFKKVPTPLTTTQIYQQFVDRSIKPFSKSTTLFASTKILKLLGR